MKYKRFVVKIGTAILGAAMITSAFSVAGIENTVRADVATNSVLMLNSGKTLDVETPKDVELDVPKIQGKKLKDLPGVDDPFIFKWKKGDSYEREFKVTKSGVYSVFSSDAQHGFKIENSMGATISSRTYAYSNSVYTAQLKAGSTYKFYFVPAIGLDVDACNYTVCPPKDVVDVTGYTSIDDSFEFIGQSIEYKYTAPKTGKFRIEHDKSLDNYVDFVVSTEDGSEIQNINDLAPAKGFFVNFEKGQTYVIKLTCSKVTDFTYSINAPKDSVDITKYTKIKDNLEYDQQSNMYEYTAPRSGTYNISLSDVKDMVYLRASDSKGDKIKTVSTKKSVNFNIDMQKGAKYVFEAFPYEYNDNTVTPYTITITPQKPTVDISNYDVVKDSVTFGDQKNEYTFKATEDGKYAFNVTYGDQGSFAIYDAKNNKVKSWTNYNQNTVHKIEVELTKGTYRIVFDNNSSVGFEYKIDITKPTVNNDQIKGFIERIYTYVLNRESEEEGVNFWYSELYNFNRTGAEVAQGFIFSPEFENRNTTNEEFIEILYKTFFGRESDVTGMTYWLSLLESGTSRMDVANGFIFSQEWADTCASYGIRSGCDSVAATVAIKPTDATNAFVERMYTTAMKRASDKSGKEYWASELSNFRTTGENVGAAFFLSEEMTNFKLSDKEYLDRLYSTFMDREADSDGAAYWLDQLANGATRAQVVYGFTRSPEFVEKCVAARILPYLDTAVPGVG